MGVVNVNCIHLANSITNRGNGGSFGEETSKNPAYKNFWKDVRSAIWPLTFQWKPISLTSPVGLQWNLLSAHEPSHGPWKQKLPPFPLCIYELWAWSLWTVFTWANSVTNRGNGGSFAVETSEDPTCMKFKRGSLRYWPLTFKFYFHTFHTYICMCVLHILKCYTSDAHESMYQTLQKHSPRQDLPSHERSCPSPQQ